MAGALAPAVRRLAGALGNEGFPFAFIGGIAVNVWAAPRATFDLDVLVGADAAEEPRLGRALQRAGFTSWSAKPQADIRLPIWSLMCGERPSRVYVDLFFARTPYQLEALKRRRSARFGPSRVPVLSPEDLLLHKLLAERARDLGDVESILAIRGTSLDWVYVRAWARKLGLKLPKRPR